MTYLQTLILSGAVVALTACSTPAKNATHAVDNDVPTKTASPAADKSRMEDCIGENQTSKGTTRPDCLPNDADGAARDTEAGSGGTILRP